MRKVFAELTESLMGESRNVFLLTGDLGYGIWDSARVKYPERAINVGAAEQLLVGAGVGLALTGKIAICYSITPFLLYRPFEIIRNYIDYEKIPVKLVGSGRGKDYSHDGFSHWAEDDEAIMSNFKNISVWHPKTTDELRQNFLYYMSSVNPCYINLKR